MHENRNSFTSAWRDRLASLRNMPPVLKIVWQSGPWVVSPDYWPALRSIGGSGGNSRCLFTHHSNHWRCNGSGRGRPNIFLVAGRRGIRAGHPGRGVEPSDCFSRYSALGPVFAPRQHHGSSTMHRTLDLAATKIPNLTIDRARGVQATDRLVMIQATGQLIQRVLTTIFFAGPILFFSPWLLLLLLAYYYAGVSRRKPFRVPGLCVKP